VATKKQQIKKEKQIMQRLGNLATGFEKEEKERKKGDTHAKASVEAAAAEGGKKSQKEKERGKRFHERSREGRDRHREGLNSGALKINIRTRNTQGPGPPLDTFPLRRQGGSEGA